MGGFFVPSGAPNRVRQRTPVSCPRALRATGAPFSPKSCAGLRGNRRELGESVNIRRLLAAVMGAIPLAGVAQMMFGVPSPSQDDEQTELRALSLIRNARQAVMGGAGVLRDVLRGLHIPQPTKVPVYLRALLSLWLVHPDGTKEPQKPQDP
jgi:hypothetical protein